MSYILDALDKAERERKRGQPPAQHTNERSAAEPGTRSPWLWVAVFAVVFNALLAGLLIYSSTHDTKEIKTASLPPPIVETQPITPAAPLPAATPAPAPAPASIPSPAPAPAPAPAPELQIHRATPPAAAPTVLLMTDQELQAQARQLEMEAAPVADPPPAGSDPTPAVAAPAPTDTPLEMIPLLVEMSQQLQQSLPPIRVDVHVHASKMENRFVMINLRRYREGDEVAPGLTLERITKEGMVLKFRGERFRYLMRT